MADQLQLAGKHRRILEDLLREHLPGVDVWAYGSRVNGRSHDGSDLDLVLRGPGLEEIPIEQLGDFWDALYESSIPFLVEARDWARLPERFHQEIKHDHVVLSNCALRETRFAALLAEPVRNGIYKTKPFHGRGVKMINMGELFAHPRLRDIPMKRVDLNESEQERFCVQHGDLLFARRSLVAEGAGKCCVLLEAPEPTAFESSIIRARPDPLQADPLYLYYYFNSPIGLHGLDTIRRQVAVAGITGRDLANLRIRLPRIREQRTIANVLGALDDKIELNRRMNETLETMARALFKSWFVGFEPVLAKMAPRNPGLPEHIADLFPDSLDDEHKPSGWSLETLTALARVNPESWSSGNTPEQVDYVDLANTKRGTIEATQRFRWQDAPSRARRILRPGDTIIGTVRPGNGSFALIAAHGLTGSTGFTVLRPRQRHQAPFVYLAATAPENIERLARLADGAAYPAVRPDVVGATPAAIPDDVLMAAFSEATSPVLRQIESNKAQNETLAQVRDFLLPKLISGEVRVSEAERTIRETVDRATADV